MSVASPDPARRNAAVSKFIPKGMGWIPDLPDTRDYTYRHEGVASLFRSLRRPKEKKPPAEIDLRSDADGHYLTSVEDQSNLNSSSAFAVLALVEYFERRICGQTFEGSKLFLYKVTRNRMRVRGDAGADLRTTLKVLRSIGVPPEEHGSYLIEAYDDEPSPFLYSLAQARSELRYLRLDEPEQSGVKTWKTIRSFLAAGFPIALGFSVPSSLTSDADIPFRPGLDAVRGGQCAVAVGYQMHHFARGQHALLIRNSWGSQWGAEGNGWLPVALIRRRIVRDCWTLISEKWVESNELTRPSCIE